jgi:hypothetical protein
VGRIRWLVCHAITRINNCNQNKKYGSELKNKVKTTYSTKENSTKIKIKQVIKKGLQYEERVSIKAAQNNYI